MFTTQTKLHLHFEDYTSRGQLSCKPLPDRELRSIHSRRLVQLICTGEWYRSLSVCIRS